jgi:large subunit ribosomal protein L6
MSRIGKKPIEIPAQTEVRIDDGRIFVKGPLGELSRSFNKEDVSITISDNIVTVAPIKETLEAKALWGTYASHIGNMIKGVNTVFVKKLVLEGIGLKAEVRGDKLVMSLGFSHPVEMSIPKDLSVLVEKNVLTISGINKEIVGEFAARVRSKKKPEPYKGKGMRYEGEVIKIKQGKKSA